MYGKTDPTLKGKTRLPDNAGLIFDRAATPESNVARTLELWAWRDGYRINLSIDSSDWSFDPYQRAASEKTRTTDTAEKMTRLLNVYARTRGRADNEVPEEKGTCTQNGFVAGPPGDAESVAIFYHLKSAPDVYFVLKTNSGFREKTELLDRDKDIKRALEGGDGKVLRKARAKGVRMDYQELLAEGRTVDRVKGHMFVAEANSLVGSAMRPVVMIDLNNGERIPAPPLGPTEDPLPDLAKATLGTAEAVAIWDAVMPTLRPRPGAF